MLTVYNCITLEHDLRLVALAGFICLFASFSAMNLLARAREGASWRSTLWIPASGAVAGCGIWATHFIGILAFRPGEDVTYAAGATVISFFLSITLSVVMGIVFSTMAFQLKAALGGVRGRIAGTGFLSLAICALHFTGMTAATVTFDPAIEFTRPTVQPLVLSIAIATITVFIGAFGFLGSAIDRHLASRSAQEAKRLRAHVMELEETKRKLEATSEDLMVALKSVASADQAKAQFLATMSHELRTPLNAILGFSEIMKSETFGPLGNERYLEYSDDIYKSGQHLLSLINDVLDFTRADAGKLQLHDEEVDIEDVIYSAIRMLKQQADTHALKLHIDIAADMPALLADHRRIRQVLLNLLSNAVKFTPDGGDIHISAAVENGTAKIRVRDTGIGIAKEDIPVALERFGQIDSDIARKYEGTGLGLPLSKCLMEGHGGTLEIESEPGHGTTVTLTFPPERLRPPSEGENRFTA